MAAEAAAQAGSVENEAAEARLKMEGMSGSRAEQMQRCDDTSRRLQEIRSARSRLKRIRETLTAAVQSLEARFRPRRARKAA